MKHNVFVYGTLKRGKKNHHFLQLSKFLGTALLAKNHRLYQDEFPCLVEEDSDEAVHGEIYEVNEATLAKLDELEEHPAWYMRQLRSCELNDELIEAWVYIFPKQLLKEARPIEKGIF